MTVPAGRYGGVMKCGKTSGDGGDFAVCGWADHGSVAMAMFANRARRRVGRPVPPAPRRRPDPGLTARPARRPLLRTARTRRRPTGSPRWARAPGAGAGPRNGGEVGVSRRSNTAVSLPVGPQPGMRFSAGMQSRPTPSGSASTERLSGGVLLSHTLPSAVPSALEGLASGFGM